MDLILDWNLDKKLFSIVVDNASVNDGMVRSLKSWLCEKSLIPLDGELFHVRCSAHILNLVVQDGLKLIGDFIHKVRETVKYLKRSPYATQKFNNAKSQLKLWDKKKIKMDCPTRWNSTFLMLESELEMKEVFVRLAQTDRGYKFDPSNEEWEVSRVLSGCLKMFYNTTTLFSGSEYPTSNLFFPEICDIQLELIEWERSEHSFLRLMVGPMKIKFNKYWEECSLVLAITVVFDPRFKLDVVQYYYGKLHGDDAHKYVERVRGALFDIFNEYSPQNESHFVQCNEGPASGSSSGTSKGNKFDGFDAWYLHGRPAGTCFYRKSELEQYLEEPLFPRNENFNILNWWKVNGAKLPVLVRIARDILAIPATTVASEAAFSVGGRVIDESRASLLPEIVEALMVIKDWLPSKKQKAEVCLIDECIPWGSLDKDDEGHG